MKTRLLGLILVPLLGGSAAAAAQIGTSLASARSAASAEVFIRAATALDSAQASFSQEVVPAFTAAVLRNPALLSTVANPGVVKTVGAVSTRLAALRRTTDSAVSALTSAGRLRQRFRAELVAARAGIDNPTVLSAALNEGTKFSADLAVAENTQVTAATNAGIDAHGAQALDDVQLTARANQAAAAEVSSYAGTQFPASAGVAQPQLAWVQAWTAYNIAARDVTNLASPGTARAWTAANASVALSGFNSFLAAQVRSGSPRQPITAVAKLVVEDGARNHAYAAVLTAALQRALAAGRAQRGEAVLHLQVIIGIAVLLLVISLAISVLIGRSITRPLGRLARQATRISEGELIDVLISGPREVRTVASALSNSIVSLRNIEAHAAAVAAGELDSEEIRQSLPGPLGQVVQSSLARIIDAITEREQAQLALAHRAAHDELTELPNRAQAQVLIELALHRAQRSGTSTALMFLDLDDFKNVNDIYGHAAGDELLKIVADRLLRGVRHGDSVARVGGDEFVVLLENVADEADIVHLAEKLVEEISADVTVAEGILRVSASAGLAFCRDGWVDADRLLQEADAANYRAKKHGRGRVDVFDDALRRELIIRNELEEAIETGLAAGQFVLYYQPVIDLNTNLTIGVEALIRWDRPGHGIVAPDEFIPTAERSTLINDIGRWVLLEATQQLARWDSAQPAAAGQTMAVNISGRHLATNQLIPDVCDALARSGIDPARLILEITETVLVDDDPLAIDNMRALRSRGVKVAIDDFGTGFTSIGRLPTLQVDLLKIDRSFVASPDPAQYALVQLIASAAHAFGLTVVAEGIENGAQAERMRRAHIEQGQGYLFARPQPPRAHFPRTENRTSEPV